MFLLKSLYVFSQVKFLALFFLSYYYFCCCIILSCFHKYDHSINMTLIHSKNHKHNFRLTFVSLVKLHVIQQRLNTAFIIDYTGFFIYPLRLKLYTKSFHFPVLALYRISPFALASHVLMVKDFPLPLWCLFLMVSSSLWQPKLDRLFLLWNDLSLLVFNSVFHETFNRINSASLS